MIDETPGRTPAASRLRAGLIWLLVGPLALWTLIRAPGIEAGYPLVPMLAFTPYVAAASVVLLGVTLARRDRAAAAVTGLAVIVLAASGPPRVMAGDFNATLDHAALRRLAGTGYRDAASQVGAGFTPTWPYDGDRAAVTPKVAIDHILVSGSIGVLDFTAVTVPRTDHRAIIAVLVLPAG